jgi:hypothetical protein
MKSKFLADFGVRALLAAIAAAGYYIPLVYVFFKIQLPTETIIALLSAAGSPWLLAMGFYFGTKQADKAQEKTNTDITSLVNEVLTAVKKQNVIVTDAPKSPETNTPAL